jgi:hypothetical protein
MANPIQLQLVQSQPVPPPPAPPITARSQINEAQVQALIGLLASSDPQLVILPEGKQFTDVKSFSVRVLPDGKGVVNVIF